VNYLLLNKSILIKLGHMFPWINLVVTGLSDRYYKASTKAAASKNRHNAEIKEHGSPGVHMLGAGYTSI